MFCAQVRLIVVSELNIYFYSLGQILRGSNINRISTANSENVIRITGSSILLTDWEITLNIEAVDFSGTHGADCLKDQESYDNCMISQFLKPGNNSMISSLFLEESSKWPPDLRGASIEVIQEYYSTIISQDAARNCPKSCSFFQVQYEQKAKRDESGF